MRPRWTSTNVAVFVALAILVSPSAEGSPTYRLCGKHLADILALICKGRGFYDPSSSRSPDSRGVAYLQSGTGVSDECCRRGCTRTTMEKYCSEDPVDNGHLAAAGHGFLGDHQGGAIGHDTTDGSSAVDASGVSKVSGGGRGGKRKKEKGRKGRRKGKEERGRRKGEGGAEKRCRCKRRRRKVLARPRPPDCPGVCPTDTRMLPSVRLYPTPISPLNSSQTHL